MTLYNGQISRIKSKIDRLSTQMNDLAVYIRSSQQETRDEVNKLCIGLSGTLVGFGEIHSLPDLPPAPVPPLIRTSSISEKSSAKAPSARAPQAGIPKISRKSS